MEKAEALRELVLGRFDKNDDLSWDWAGLGHLPLIKACWEYLGGVLHGLFSQCLALSHSPTP
jgi:hypothetical protein